MKRRAFTLIELLVVVAIIALLMSILLPTLTRAREQARVAKCLANMRAIAQAAVGYVQQDKNLVFCWPIGYRVGNEGSQRSSGQYFYTEFMWGGQIPDGTTAQWDDSQGDSSIIGKGADTMWYTAKERPLNNFLFPGVSFDQPGRLRADGVGNTNRVATAMDLPDTFRCPSDATAAVPYANSPDPTRELDSPIQTWKFWGHSYPINWYWGYFYPTGILEAIAGDVDRKIKPLSDKIIRQKNERGAAEWILFYENLMNYNLESAKPRGFTNGSAKATSGWHKQPGYHVAAFFDGHSVYRKFDTTYIDGPGWTTWPNRPWDDSPTYKPYENN